MVTGRRGGVEVDAMLFSLSKALASSNPKVVGSMGCTLRGIKRPAPSMSRLHGFVKPPLGNRFVRRYKVSRRGTTRVIALCQRCFAIANVFRGDICSNMRRVLGALGRTKVGVTVTASGPRGFTGVVTSRFKLTRCFSIVNKTYVSRAHARGRSIVHCILRRYRRGRLSGVMVIKSHSCSMIKNRTRNLGIVNILCKCKSLGRLSRTNTSTLTAAPRRMTGLLLRARWDGSVWR